MTIQLVGSWHTLMNLAKELGKARLTGNQEKIKEAKKAHDSYRDFCLKADRMI